MGFAADITGTLAGLIPAQQAAVSGLAAPPRPIRTQTEKSTALRKAEPQQGGDLLPISLISEAVQECLQESIQDSASALYALMADDEILTLVHDLLKKPGDREGVGRSLQDVVDAFSALAAKDGQPSDVVAAIAQFIDRLKQTASQLSRIRRRAGDSLTQQVAVANDLLAKIAETNREILLSGATGAKTSGAAARQQVYLSHLAQLLDFRSFRREDGSVSIYTKQGIALAGGESATLVPTDDGVNANGVDIMPQLAGGAVHGYLHNRDVVLPGVQSQLDTLAQTLQSRINQLTNRAIAGADARPTYRSGRLFTDPAGYRIALIGGDTEILLLQDDGSPALQASLSATIKSYRSRMGLPAAGVWPIGQLLAAMKEWVGRHVGSADLLSISSEGRLLVDLPRQSGLRLALRDRRSLSLQSPPFAAAERAVGLQGQLTLRDGLGNLFSTHPSHGGVALSPQDNLAQLATKLNRIDGLSVALQAGESGQRLIIASRAGSDLIVEPDPGQDLWGHALPLVPADDQPREDVAVNLVTLSPGNAVISRGFPDKNVPLGLQGCLILRDRDGAMLAFQTMTADWSLERLADRLQNASDPRLAACLVQTGNQTAAKIHALAPEDRFLIEGWPEAWQTSPRFDFAARGGAMQISVAGQPLGSADIAPGSSFSAISDQVNAADSLWSRKLLRAQILRAGNAEILEISHRHGLPLAFAGDAIGAAPDQLDFRYNLRDQLGLNPTAEQVVPGLANFLGLNDLFVAEPDQAFDSKAAIGIFTTTALPGTAQSLALSPGLAEDPARLGTVALTRQISDLLCNSCNIAAAGTLPKGSFRLVHYAEAIAAGIHASVRSNKTQLSYHHALLSQLGREKAADINVNDRLSALMALQQTYHDSTQIVAGLGRLTDQLKPPQN